MILSIKTDDYILNALGYSGSSLSNDAEKTKIFRSLFGGLTAEEARDYFTSEYTDIEFNWYFDFDNY